MAIVNVTPDSFSDGGDRLDPVQAIDDGLRFVSEGADIVDVGGESTRPGALPTPPEEEMRRIRPVVEGLVRQGVLVSIDTRRASVAEAALDEGARIVNDVSALRDDAAMLPLVVRRDADLVLMHRRGLPENTFAGPAYDNVVEDVLEFLLERAALCETAGMMRDRIALDPGIGFGKGVAQELDLIAGAGRLAAAGYPVLIGCSRKSFIGKLTGIAKASDRDPASIWLAVEAVRRGASIVRVHDVAGTRQALAVSEAMR
ncbi:MAG: dihydropteroate synthase [Proteobacteria bacterium]|nr:dihydropteroate synthase [Pseudomonadota bacterium]